MDQGTLPVHEIKVNVASTKGIQRQLYCLIDIMVPLIVKFRCDPDVITSNFRVFDSLTDFVFAAACESGILKTVSGNSGRGWKADLYVDSLVLGRVEQLRRLY